MKFKAGDHFVVTENGNEGTIFTISVMNGEVFYFVQWPDDLSRQHSYLAKDCDPIWEHKLPSRNYVPIENVDVVCEIEIPGVSSPHNHNWKERQGFTNNFLACQCGASKDL